MRVRKSLHLVGSSRQHCGQRPTLRWSACWSLLALSSGCGENPEVMLSKRWQESEWSYERMDPPAPGSAFWADPMALSRQRDHRVVRHEAEYWEFRRDGTLIISRRGGEKVAHRWRLKGRGHVLTIGAGGRSGPETYDVKELNQHELVLQYDVGMEVRGIARLRFRDAAQAASADARTARRADERRRSE